MADIHKMVLRLFRLWSLDDNQQSILLAILDEDEYLNILLLQIHAMLRLLYPNHPLRYEWITRSNSKLGGYRPIDIIISGSEGVQQVNKLLRIELLR